jgi:hypothetical protein
VQRRSGGIDLHIATSNESSHRAQPVASCYELRLFNQTGAPILIYRVTCRDDAAAEAKIHAMKDMPYRHFEIWRDDLLVQQGWNLRDVTLSAAAASAL